MKKNKISKGNISKTRELIVQKQKEIKNVFAGSVEFLKSGNSVEKDLILKVAEAFELPVVCVGVQGGMPYINKDGLLYKLEEYYGDEIQSLVSKGIQYSLKKGERAVFESTLVLKDGKTFNAVGEADDENVKLAAVKTTPNLMAETRSQNRVIRRAIQAQMLKQMFGNLNKDKNKQQDDIVDIIQNAVSTSAEEMERPDIKKPAAKVEPQKDWIQILEKGFEGHNLKTVEARVKFITTHVGTKAAYDYQEWSKKGMTQVNAMQLIKKIQEGMKNAGQ